MATTAEILDAIDTAILSLVAGEISSVDVNGYSFTYNDLGELRRIRATLTAEVNNSGGSAIRVADISGT